MKHVVLISTLLTLLLPALAYPNFVSLDVEEQMGGHSLKKHVLGYGTNTTFQTVLRKFKREKLHLKVLTLDIKVFTSTERVSYFNTKALATVLVRQALTAVERTGVLATYEAKAATGCHKLIITKISNIRSPTKAGFVLYNKSLTYPSKSARNKDIHRTYSNIYNVILKSNKAGQWYVLTSYPVLDTGLKSMKSFITKC